MKEMRGTKNSAKTNVIEDTNRKILEKLLENKQWICKWQILGDILGKFLNY